MVWPKLRPNDGSASYALTASYIDTTGGPGGSGGAPTAWVKFNGYPTDSSGNLLHGPSAACTIHSNYNVESVTHGLIIGNTVYSGVYKITFKNPMSNINYFPIGSGRQPLQSAFQVGVTGNPGGSVCYELGSITDGSSNAYDTTVNYFWLATEMLAQDIRSTRFPPKGVPIVVGVTIFGGS